MGAAAPVQPTNAKRSFIRYGASALKTRATVDRDPRLKLAYPLTPPAVRPLVRFFSMDMNKMTTGMMAKMEAANRATLAVARWVEIRIRRNRWGNEPITAGRPQGSPIREALR